MDNQEAFGRQGPKAFPFPCLQASSILAHVSPCRPFHKAREQGGAQGWEGRDLPCWRSPLITLCQVAFLFLCCVCDGLCSHQIKPGKLPILYGVTCCTDPTDLSML